MSHLKNSRNTGFQYVWIPLKITIIRKNYAVNRQSSIVNRQSSIVNRQNSVKTITHLSTIIGFVALSCATIPVYAVSNAAGTSFAVRNTTKNPADGTQNCTLQHCIVMSFDGVLDNNNHGVFLKHMTGSCYAPSGGINGGQFVVLSAAMTSTTISTLTFTTSGLSSLCTTANTWHIFRTTATTPNTIWAVKLDGSANMPATLDATNFMECSPTGNFNTTTGCGGAAAAAVSAPIDIISSGKSQTFSKEVGLK